VSGKALGWVIDNSPHTGTTYTVHLILGDIANDDNDNRLWLTVDRIAVKARCSTRSARTALSALVGSGHLALVELSTGRHPTTYRFVMDDADTNPAESAGVAAEPGKMRHRTRQNASSTPITNERNASAVDAQFAEFWSAYPARRGVKRGKARTLKLWERVDVPDRAHVIRAARNYAASDDAVRGFAKDPERFLRDQWWEDWIDVGGSTGDGYPDLDYSEGRVIG
jgi:hypothetical protein